MRDSEATCEVLPLAALFEVSSPMMTFVSISDMFIGMSEVQASTVTVLAIETSGG